MTTQKPLSARSKKAFLAPYDNWQNRIATHEFVRDIPLKESHRSRQTLKAIDDGLKEFKRSSYVNLLGKT